MTGKLSFPRDATGLVKNISAFDSFAMGLSGMGLLYVYSAVAFSPAFFPAANPIMYSLVGFILILPLGGAYVLMGSKIPRDGGDYVWVSRVLHPGTGFTVNFAMTAITLSFIGTSTSAAVQWGLAELFYDFGILYRDPLYLNAASFLQANVPTLALSLLLILLAALIVGGGSQVATRVVRWWSALAVVIGILFVWTVISSGPSGFMTNFNALSGSDYHAVIAAGQQLGAQPNMPSFLSTQNIYAGAFSLLGFLGFNFPAYFSGEIKQVRKSNIIAIFGGIAVYALFKTILTAVEYFGEGPAFANAVGKLWIAGSTNFPYLAAPLASGMSVFWTTNPVLVAVFNLSYVGTIEAMNIAILFSLSRNLFAWSFDRIAPQTFADINHRTGTPLNALIAMTLGAMLYVYLAVFQFGLLSALFSYGVLGAFLVFMVVSIAVIVYPLRAKSFPGTLESSMNSTETLLFLVLGIASLSSSTLVVYSIIQHAVAEPVESILFNGVVPTFALGGILYLVAYIVRKHQGIEVGLIGKILPPE